MPHLQADLGQRIELLHPRISLPLLNDYHNYSCFVVVLWGLNKLTSGNSLRTWWPAWYRVSTLWLAFYYRAKNSSMKQLLSESLMLLERRVCLLLTCRAHALCHSCACIPSFSCTAESRGPEFRQCHDPVLSIKTQRWEMVSNLPHVPQLVSRGTRTT